MRREGRKIYERKAESARVAAFIEAIFFSASLHYKHTHDLRVTSQFKARHLSHAYNNNNKNIAHYKVLLRLRFFFFFYWNYDNNNNFYFNDFCETWPKSSVNITWLIKKAESWIESCENRKMLMLFTDWFINA